MLISINVFYPKEGAFQINGELGQNVDHVIVVIQYSNQGKEIIDTCKVTNHKFQLKGNISEPVLSTLTLIEKNQESVTKQFFIEAGKIHLKMDKQLANFKVQGSSTNKDYENLTSEIHSIEKKQESLNKQHDQLLTRYQQFRKQGVQATDLKALADSIYSFYDEISKLETFKYPYYKKFIYDHPNSYVSAYALKVWQQYYIVPKDARPALLSLNLSIQNSFQLKIFRKALAFFEQTEPGKKAHDFSLPDSNGHTISLKNFKGNYVLLDFCASWCHPCRIENKELNKLYNQFHSKGFEIIGIAMDESRSAWVNAIQKDELNDIQLCDFKLKEGEAAQKYIWNIVNQAYTLPQNVLIDKNGIIIGRDLTITELETRLHQLL